MKMPNNFSEKTKKELIIASNALDSIEKLDKATLTSKSQKLIIS